MNHLSNKYKAYETVFINHTFEKYWTISRFVLPNLENFWTPLELIVVIGLSPIFLRITFSQIRILLINLNSHECLYNHKRVNFAQISPFLIQGACSPWTILTNESISFLSIFLSNHIWLVLPVLAFFIRNNEKKNIMAFGMTKFKCKWVVLKCFAKDLQTFQNFTIIDLHLRKRNETFDLANQEILHLISFCLFSI